MVESVMVRIVLFAIIIGLVAFLYTIATEVSIIPIIIILFFILYFFISIKADSEEEGQP